MSETPLSSYVRARIPNGGTASEVISGQGMDLVGIIIPAAFTGVAMTFQVSGDGTNFFPAYDDAGTQISVVVAPGRYQALSNSNLKALRGIRFMKVVSGSAEGAQRDVYCIFGDR